MPKWAYLFWLKMILMRWLKMGTDLNLKDGCINALSFLEQSGVLTQEQQQEIECLIMNLEVVKNG